MKKGVSLLLFFALALLSFAGCGKSLKKVEENTVYVRKNGKITGVTVESFDKEYYDAGELEAYIDGQVEEYNDSHGKKSVSVDSFSVKEGVARLEMGYAGCEDYAAFNGVVLFSGTVPQAMAAGYDFKTEFRSVEKGKLGDSADRDTVLDDAELKVVVLDEKLDVMIDGTVRYVSAKYASPTAKDAVSIKLPEEAQDGEELALVYVVYK